MPRLLPSLWIALALGAGCLHEEPAAPEAPTAKPRVLRASITIEGEEMAQGGYVGHGFPRRERWGEGGKWSCDEPNTTMDIKDSHIFIYTTVADPLEGQVVRRCTVAFANTEPMRVELKVRPAKSP